MRLPCLKDSCGFYEYTILAIQGTDWPAQLTTKQVMIGLPENTDPQPSP